jgi:penicillin-binding protein 2
VDARLRGHDKGVGRLGHDGRTGRLIPGQTVSQERFPHWYNVRMRRYIPLALILALMSLLAAVACSGPPAPEQGPPPAPSPAAPPTLTPTPTPAPSPTPIPSPAGIAESYLKAWEASRFDEMYDLLSRLSQETIARERFVQRHKDITEGSTILSVRASLLGPEPPSHAEGRVEVPFSVVMATARVGEIRESNVLPLVQEDGLWRVAWSPSLFFKELTPDGRVRFEPINAVRGTIYDRKGRPLAVQGEIVSVGLVPGRIEDEAAVLSALQRRLNISPERARAAMANAQPHWFVPLRDLSSEQAAAVRAELDLLPGVMFRAESARAYPNGPVAAHVVGYLSRVTEEEMEALASRGYGEDDVIGRMGIEEWADERLAGEGGGRLSVVSPLGETVKVIGQKPARAGEHVHLSIDLDLQKLAEESLGEQAGSVVLLDARSNAVLALASYPRFDPNKFVTGFTQEEWDALSGDERYPFQNRPVASAYPVASTFKAITMAAGLERGGFTPESPFECTGRWAVGDGTFMGDWLPQGHGRLNLFQGLVESCNIVFYEVGKELDSIDTKLLPEFARGFGFGRPTGLVGLHESEGLVPDPDWKRANEGTGWYLGDTVNLAIGQGAFLATPLQLANAYAAIARGGELMAPVLVGEPTGPSVQFQPRPQGSVPASPATLDAIRRAMKLVTSDPKGTANYAFRGSNLSVAAKTGSAEVQGPDSHAWFAAFAPAEQPEVVMVVMVEEKGMGSEVAAPVARKILEGYFR